jgi:hypothetical protein
MTRKSLFPLPAGTGPKWRGMFGEFALGSIADLGCQWSSDDAANKGAPW